MPMTNKVFIFSDSGRLASVSNESANDLVELFSTDQIFSGRPDVMKIDHLMHNFSGISNPVFVIPGGSTSAMYHKLNSILKLNIENQPYHYVGICAGAFLGAHQAHLYIAAEQLRSFIKGKEPYLPNYFFSLEQTLSSSLDLISDYDAIGEIYPVTYDHRKDFLARKSTLTMNETGQTFTQLYASGPAFLVTAAKKDKIATEVVATYADALVYRFNNELGSVTEYNQLPAIIKRKATAEKGGVLLAGTHIEATVKDSQLLRFFRSETASSHALSEADILDLEKNQDKDRQLVEVILKNTLT